MVLPDNIAFLYPRLLRTFGERPVMAQLVAKRLLVSPLTIKDF